MVKWIIKPLKSVNGIKFGMSRQEVRDMLGSPASEFKKSKFSKTLTDNYTLFHVFYDSDDRVEAVEIFEGIEVVVDGKIIFPEKINIIKNLPYHFESDGESFYCETYSIGIFAPSEEMESILFGKKGYYN